MPWYVMKSLDQRNLTHRTERLRHMRVGIALVLAAFLVGCSEDPDPQHAVQPPGPMELVSMSAAGGEQLGTKLRSLDTGGQVHRFLNGFDDRFQAKLRRAIDAYEVPDGYELGGGVAYIGCGVPDDATVVGVPPQERLQPGPTHDESIECFAPVTTVGIVALPVLRS